MALPISIKQLMETNLIESERLELKEGFNPEKILHTMCAFANDFNNWGGGYIIIGVGDNKESKGINKNQIDPIMKKIVELANKIQYPYFPVVEPVEYKNNSLIVLYCPGGAARPYKAPKTLSKGSEYKYYIRHSSSTVIANSNEERELISMSNQIPFDDQINYQASIEDIDINLIKSFLKEANSSIDPQIIPFEELCRSLNIVNGSNEAIKPKNVGLLLFSNNPEKHIKTPRIEIVTFHDDIGDDFEEEIIQGDMVSQIKRALQYIKNTAIKERVQKIPEQAEAKRFFSYPYEAIKEALVNAVYHKSYEEDNPVEVRIELNKIEIISYPGPLPPLNKENINSGKITPRKYRNRRIGDFLKELDLTEGRNTGLAKIKRVLKNNGSPKPVFETDEERVYFKTTLKIHPEFKKAQAEAQVEAQAEAQVEDKILMALKSKELSVLEILIKIGQKTRSGGFKNALSKLSERNLIEQTIPDKPSSPKQKYQITKKGIQLLNSSFKIRALKN